MCMYVLYACACTYCMHVHVRTVCMCMYVLYACACTYCMHVHVRTVCMYVYATVTWKGMLAMSVIASVTVGRRGTGRGTGRETGRGTRRGGGTAPVRGPIGEEEEEGVGAGGVGAGNATGTGSTAGGAEAGNTCTYVQRLAIAVPSPDKKSRQRRPMSVQKINT